ncbi:MAG TPA: hypothetical protein VMW95_08085, partial [Desulfobacterales bacterium]|nr:hypothetical protein [Desulfobacterales bacterium]
ELYPAIALGPWTSLLNQMIYPGWQKFKPLHRYAVILEGTIDYENNTCAVAVQPTFSLMNYYVNKSATGGGDPAAGSGIRSSRVKNYGVNYGDTLGTEEIILLRRGILEKAAAQEFFIQNTATAHPGFVDFCERNPGHPIANVGKLNPPIYITDEQYIQVRRICLYIDAFYGYLSDKSGYKVADYWDVMYDIGDPWYWWPAYIGEPQSELTFGNINLLYEDTGKTSGKPKFGIDVYYQSMSIGSGPNWYTARNLELEFAANQLHLLGPRAKRAGDCVSINEEIYTKHGIKKVGDLKVGDLVLSYDFEKKGYCHKPIIKIWEKGLLPGKKVGLKNGQSIEITENHPLWARTNQTSGRAKYKISHYEKVYFKDINLDQWWKRRLPIAVKIPYIVKDIEWLNEDLCFVLGHYLAEGWKEPSKVQTSGYELTEHIFPLLKKNDIPFSDYKNNSGVPCARILKGEFKEFLKTLKGNSFDIHLPEELFHLPGSKLEKILSGFFLGDGHNGNYNHAYSYTSNKQEVYSTSSKQWASDIQRIGLQLGRSFHIWKQKKHGGVGNKPIYRVTYNPKSHFLRDHGFNGISEVGIARKHIEDAGLVEMRDFEVADTHTFIFKNGLICHQCEDFVLTKMQAIIEAGIIPAANLQILLCYVVNAGYHAVLGIQTANRGFLISDQRDYGQLWEIEQLSRTHIWESFSVATAAGEGAEAIKWAKTQLIIQDVPFEYMDCNGGAFTNNDEVIVEFTGQDWANPKVIGFKANPVPCSGSYVFPGANAFGSGWFEETSRSLKLFYISESWAWKAPFSRDYIYPGEDNFARVGYAA